MSKPCIINVGIGAWYPKGQARLVNSLAGRYDGEILRWTTLPPGSPPHHDVPYAFKLHAFMSAFTQGYNPVLWLDASMWARDDLGPIFEHIEEHGVAVYPSGWWVGQWSTKECLAKMNVTRDEAMKIPLVAGGIVGIDKKSPVGKSLFERWYKSSKDGSFIGPWTNNGMDEDKRVLGHRHDMPSLSVLAHEYGVKTGPEGHFAYAAKDSADDKAIIVARGM